MKILKTIMSFPKLQLNPTIFFGVQLFLSLVFFAYYFFLVGFLIRNLNPVIVFSLSLQPIFCLGIHKDSPVLRLCLFGVLIWGILLNFLPYFWYFSMNTTFLLIVYSTLSLSFLFWLDFNLLSDDN